MKKHTFPKNKNIVCGKKLNSDEIRELVKACFTHDVHIHYRTFEQLVDDRHPYFIWSCDDDDKCITQTNNTDISENYDVVSFEEFLQYVRGERVYKNSNIELRLNDQYKAIITSTEIKVGCQTFTFETITELYKAVQTQKRRQNKKS